MTSDPRIRTEYVNGRLFVIGKMDPPNPYQTSAEIIAELHRHVHDLVCLLNFADRRIPDDMQKEYMDDKAELKEELRRHHQRQKGE